MEIRWFPKWNKKHESPKFSSIKWPHVEFPRISVVVNKNNQHWIEWIKIVRIQSWNVYSKTSITEIIFGGKDNENIDKSQCFKTTDYITTR